MMSKRSIFLAHAHEDLGQVRELHAKLKARGFDPWLDAIDLMPGQVWKTEIPKAIRQAEVFLACLSKRSVEKRGYVQREFRMALSTLMERPPGSIYLIPVRLDDCEVPDLEIPDQGLHFRDIQWVDLWDQNGINRLLSTIERALGERARSQLAPGTAFRDIEAPWCPEMVVISPGPFMMGSTEPERRWAIEQGCPSQFADWEKPQHHVEIPEWLAVGKHLVTRGQFATFVEETAPDMSGDCWIYTGAEWKTSSSVDWCSPGFGQTDRHPVVVVGWDTAKAYAKWLANKTAQPYRLLSEAEWEYACRAGTTTRYAWGDSPPTRKQANYDRKINTTTEIGSYPPNPWGLHDMNGNVWEWVEDCWNESYEGAPRDGSARTSSDCSWRVLRGGAYETGAMGLRSAARSCINTAFRGQSWGFRVTRTLTP